MNTMKVLLQHKMSLQYLKENFDWTLSSDEAVNFGTSLRALDFCQCHNLPETQVILKFADPRYDIVLQAPATHRGHQSGSA
ncbi:MAG: hypothetical protein JWR69_3465 [Pedosphaera sp.]|nr:hypothetical protein [Pedosphaera sp.]